MRLRNLWVRIRALVRIVNELKARVAVLETPPRRDRTERGREVVSIVTNEEATILRLEREVFQLAQRIGALERARTPAAEQSALAQWYDPASTWGAPTVPFGGCTAVPTVLTAHDSKYGPFTLNYDPASGTFIGCKVVAFPGAGRCTALAAIAVQHVLVNRGTLKTSWKSAGGTSGCPVASACA